MSDKGVFGFDRLRQQTLQSVDRMLDEILSDNTGDSEIEKLFLAALRCQIGYGSIEYKALYLVPKEPEDRAGIFGLDAAKAGLLVDTQVHIGAARVDFVVYAWTPGTIFHRGYRDQGGPRWRKLVVECDGHHFHERTKEQAQRDKSRDRDIALAGYEVFRFTGSELWRDPWACAFQVYEWAIKGH